MELALYHPVLGYYARGPRSGWQGHYLTSPELDPAFGELWTRGFRLIWESCGKPSTFSLIEVGAGEGGLAAALLPAIQADFAQVLRYVIVEPLPTLRTRQRARLEGAPVEWVEDLADVPTVDAGCVFANELLDNFPVSIVEQTPSGPVELRVVADGPGLSFTAMPLTGTLKKAAARVTRSLPVGHRIEMRAGVDDFIASAAACIESGALVFVDYGYEEPDLVARPNGTLACYSNTGVDDRPLEAPGMKDITAHVNWTALRRSSKRAGLTTRGPISQSKVLAGLGLDTLLRAARASRDAAAGSGQGVSAVRALSRHQALAALADPGGLGQLEVFAALKEIPEPAFLRVEPPHAP